MQYSTPAHTGDTQTPVCIPRSKLLPLYVFPYSTEIISQFPDHIEKAYRRKSAIVANVSTLTNDLFSDGSKHLKVIFSIVRFLL